MIDTEKLNGIDPDASPRTTERIAEHLRNPVDMLLPVISGITTIDHVSTGSALSGQGGHIRYLLTGHGDGLSIPAVGCFNFSM
ncbi:hypothetical protein [Burkholderia ubonensis]|uniref:hypothetical protein n=1 Tax=Burkholderia ubonensis TaxID=101571 RepID=UPI0012FCDB57|nr:hypothetical protein [Burkholderia ubonensis]